MPERGVCPQYALGRDAIAGLAEVHRNYSSEEVFDLVAVRVCRDPAGPAYGHASEDKSRELEEGDEVEVSREEADYVLLET